MIPATPNGCRAVGQVTLFDAAHRTLLDAAKGLLPKLRGAIAGQGFHLRPRGAWQVVAEGDRYTNLHRNELVTPALVVGVFR
jgi:hypothetical protein